MGHINSNIPFGALEKKHFPTTEWQSLEERISDIIISWILNVIKSHTTYSYDEEIQKSDIYVGVPWNINNIEHMPARLITFEVQSYGDNKPFDVFKHDTRPIPGDVPTGSTYEIFSVQGMLYVQTPNRLETQRLIFLLYTAFKHYERQFLKYRIRNIFPGVVSTAQASQAADVSYVSQMSVSFEYEFSSFVKDLREFTINNIRLVLNY